ncbi:hypothetical protein M0802_009235 [Mischocyttarus mexicanus]|nr:hypothetical protein M0802_009235 [Mischocyttarus mexicanus]
MLKPIQINKLQYSVDEAAEVHILLVRPEGWCISHDVGAGKKTCERIKERQVVGYCDGDGLVVLVLVVLK